MSAFTVSISKYLAGEISLTDLMARRPNVANSPAMQHVIDAAVDVLFNNADGTKACVIEMNGHSDRDDTPGLSDEQRRDIERNRSLNRAVSAQFWLRDRVNERAQASGFPTIDNFEGDTNLTVVLHGFGASQLEVPSPASEADRLQNRRLEIKVQSPNVQVVVDNEGFFTLDD